METLSPGQIYLADQRLLEENEVYRRYSSLPASFGELLVCNDELLAAGRSQQITIAEDCCFVVVPITGEVLLNGTVADVGEVVIKYKKKGALVEIGNPYDADFINYLYLQISAGNDGILSTEKFAFDLATNQNQLVNITAGDFPFVLHIGMFAGRNEALCTLADNHSKLYAFVIAGAFEMQGRLLHERDGLALWNLAEADIEALSNNAILLLLEMKG